MRLFRTASAPSKHSRSGEDSAALSDERARATRLEAENKALRDEVAFGARARVESTRHLSMMRFPADEWVDQESLRAYLDLEQTRRTELFGDESDLSDAAGAQGQANESEGDTTTSDAGESERSSAGDFTDDDEEDEADGWIQDGWISGRRFSQQVMSSP